MNLKLDLKGSLNLPDPDFTIPMKADLSIREPQIQAKWDEQRIYHLLQDVRKDSPSFVLHDGPPYTNGPIHIGTALNKILKDFVVKSRCMMGYRAPYVPGYDNHGLPIEQAVMKDFHERKESPDIDTLRKACRAHAARFIELQSTQFKRLGIFGLWERPYATMDYGFEAEIVRVFRRMVEQGYVYRGLRPTLWSPTSRTALADTEIVYKDHVSKAIYVRFPLRRDPNRLFEKFPHLHTIIWTTTPWTIPANLAVAFNPEFEYAVVREGDLHYLVLASSVEQLSGELGWNDFEVKETLQGINMAEAVFKHPIFDRDSIAVMADYVVGDEGTGVVHTAPGHGRDDFYTGLKYNLPVLSPVDDRGILTAEAGEFAGVSYKDCDTIVVKRLEEVGNLLKVSDYSHSYPYAERDDKPVIFRATEQWFVGIDHDGLRQRMIDEIEHVSWYPQSGENRIRAMVGGRPDWCISRQRPWGVGIPVFYGTPSGEPLLQPDIIERVAELIEREGSDAWFTRPASEILPPGFVHPATGETEFRKETDVFDVWFDSGSTSLVVLGGAVDAQWAEKTPSDVYLEGSDQHRGWFNSSLVISSAVVGAAPYKAVVTHGFVMDEKGLKMSKRFGNVVDPVAACDEYGADILRYWVSSVDWANDVPCSDAILKQFGESYRRVRNTMRFLLGNLSDFNGAEPEAILPVDEWVMEQTDLLVNECVQAYERYEFGGVIGPVHNFCVQQLSSFYLDAIKDRMYCDGKDWASRRSAQFACSYVLERILQLVAPILPHTAEEVYERFPSIEKLPTVHALTFAAPSEDRLDQIEGSDLQSRFSSLLEVRGAMFADFENWKQQNDVKDSQDVIVSITDSEEAIARLKSFGDDLPNLLKVSWVELNVGDPGIEFQKSDYLKCERSRLRRPDVEIVGDVALSARDRKVLGV